MATKPFARCVQDALMPLADAERAAAMRAYMRDQFEFLGVPTPARRAATAALIRSKASAPDLMQHARALWQLPQREYQYVAVDLLARQWKALSVNDIDGLLQLAQHKSWWDSVDGLAGVVGDVIKAARSADPKSQHLMDAALVHDNLWVRRIAMLHQLGWRGETDEQRLFGYAIKLSQESDFFIRKAIGWALRDYARHAPEAVRGFLSEAGHRLSALTVREAGKHL